MIENGGFVSVVWQQLGPGSGVVRVSEGCTAEFFDAEADHHYHVGTTCALYHRQIPAFVYGAVFKQFTPFSISYIFCFITSISLYSHSFPQLSSPSPSSLLYLLSLSPSHHGKTRPYVGYIF